MPESAEIARAAEPGLMRSTDLAAFLGVSRQRVNQRGATHGFPTPRMVAGHRMWDRTEIETWADQYWRRGKPWRVRDESDRRAGGTW